MKFNIKKWALTPNVVERIEERKIIWKRLESFLKYPDDIIAQAKVYFEKNIFSPK